LKAKENMDSYLYPSDNNNNKTESLPTPHNHYQLERKRWLILLIYCMGSQLQGLVWVTFSTVSTVSLTYYSTSTNKHFTDATLDLLLNYGPIAYIPAVFLAMYLLNQSASQGLRRTIQLGALFVASGACLRCIPCFFSEETRQTR
jgi:hypothetical protein